MSEQKLPFEVLRARRAGARLAAVQALYQMEQTGQSGKAAIRDWIPRRVQFCGLRRLNWSHIKSCHGEFYSMSMCLLLMISSTRARQIL